MVEWYRLSLQYLSLIASGVANLSGTLEEQLTEADAVDDVLTFSANLGLVEINNRDAINDGVFTINGVTITVPKATIYGTVVGGTPGETCAVSGSTSYIVSRRLASI